jgi:hypothetical protein
MAMDKSPLNEGIELHDSTLGEVEQNGHEIALHLTPAYIHKSAGEPGVAPGSGWTQNVVLVILGGILEGALPEMPCELTDGTLSVGRRAWKNVIPLPLECGGDVKLALEVMWDGQLAITGEHIRATLLGEPEYVEEFSGSSE